MSKLTADLLTTAISDIEIKEKNLSKARKRLAKTIHDVEIGREGIFLSKIDVKRLYQAMDMTGMADFERTRVQSIISTFARKTEVREVDGVSYTMTFSGSQLHSFDGKSAISGSNGTSAWAKNGILYRDGDKPCYIDADGVMIFSFKEEGDANAEVAVAGYLLPCRKLKHFGDISKIVRTTNAIAGTGPISKGSSTSIDVSAKTNNHASPQPIPAYVTSTKSVKFEPTPMTPVSSLISTMIAPIDLPSVPEVKVEGKSVPEKKSVPPAPSKTSTRSICTEDVKSPSKLSGKVIPATDTLQNAASSKSEDSPCDYVFKRGENRGIDCGKSSEPGKTRCKTHAVVEKFTQPLFPAEYDVIKELLVMLNASEQETQDLMASLSGRK